MKRIFIFFCFIFSNIASSDNVIVNGTRFIYSEGDKEVTIQLTNKANRPALVQVWLDNGDPKETPDTIITPFIITPPISRVDGNSGQSIRVKLENAHNIRKDKESVWWLNVLEIPPISSNERDEGKNFLQLAIRSRFKFFYRPTGLGNRDTAAEKIIIKGQGNKLSIINPTPFYLTISSILNSDKKNINPKAVMVAPNENKIIDLTLPVRKGDVLIVKDINDYGSEIPLKLLVN